MNPVLVLLIAATPARPVYHVDLERAIRATGEGKRIAAELSTAHAKIEGEVERREAELVKLQKALAAKADPAVRARYDREADALQRYIDTEQAELDRRQDERLAPVLEKMRTLIRAAPAIVLDRSEQGPVVPRAACDATDWLARAFDRAPSALPAAEGCAARVFFLVEVPRISGALPEGKQAVAALNSFQRKRQEELDARQRALRGLEGPALERERLELASRFAAYEKELAERERTEEDRVAAAARAKVAAVERELPGVLFVEKVDGGAELGLPSCDVTKWMLDLIDGKAKIADATRVCPAYAP